MSVTVLPVEEAASLMDPIVNYLKEGSLPDAGVEAHTQSRLSNFASLMASYVESLINAHI